MTLELSKGNVNNGLVMVWTAKITAEALFNEFIVQFGVPMMLHSDKSANFEIKLIAELCRMTGIQKSHPRPYHPQEYAEPNPFQSDTLEHVWSPGKRPKEGLEGIRKLFRLLLQMHLSRDHQSNSLRASIWP